MRKAPLTLCVVGGGLTGAAAAIACLRHVSRPFKLIVIEPSSMLGRGVAYGAHHPMHLLNVRTRDLSVRAGQPGDFLNWAFRQLDQGENHAGLHEGLAHTFLPRQLFGEYVRQRFHEAVEARSDAELKLIKDVAIACECTGASFTIELVSGETLHADIVLLATAYGIAASSERGALPPFAALPGGELAAAKHIALIGSGLTMVDVLMAARREGFQGTFTVISRRGQLPRQHAPKGVVPQQTALPRSKRVSSLVAGVALACHAAEAHGTPWQAVMNGLRSSLQDIWLRLPVEEQARFLRHVRPFWDAHRHRLPLEVHARMMAEFNEGRATLLQGQVTKTERGASGFRLTLTPRGSTQPDLIEADLAFDCTGHRADVASPLIGSLIAGGIATADPHRLGLTVKRNGQVLGSHGTPTKGLFALGPLCQGSLWEITAVPEIVAQCDAAAQSIAGLARRAKERLLAVG